MAIVETGVVSNVPTTFSDTGLGKHSTRSGSTRWIGDARGLVFIKRGARGERRELSPLLDGNKG